MQQSCSRARIRVTCARASARPAPARRSAKRAERAGGWDPIQRARRFMTRATLPVRIPLIPLNPAESRIAFKFCPSWKAEPDRDTAEKCGLVSCSRSFYPCARRPRHVMAGPARTGSGYPAVHAADHPPTELAARDARNKSGHDEEGGPVGWIASPRTQTATACSPSPPPWGTARSDANWERGERPG